MISNCLINKIYDKHQFEIYLYILFICIQGFCEICEEKKNMFDEYIIEQ